MASEAGGGIAWFSLSGGATARFTGMVSYASDAPALSGIALTKITLDGQAHVVPVGPATGGLTGFAIGPDGALSPARDLDPGDKFASGAIPAAVAVETGSGPVLVSADGGGLSAYRIGDTLHQAGRIDPAAIDGPITALATPDPDLLLSAHAGSHEIHSYRIGAGGTLETAFAYGAADGAGINTPSALATLSTGGTEYAVLGAAGSHTLTVFAVSDTGALRAADHVMDSLDTRFRNVQQIEVLEHEGWSLVVVAGSDGGASVFALLPGGRLFHLHSLTWDSPPGTTTEARSLAALEASISDDALHLFAAPQGQRGLHHVVLDLSDLGAVRQGRGSVTRSDGADILITGASGTTLRGGAGADHFVFLPRHADATGHLGTVQDFALGVDLLDLSALPFFKSADQVSLRAGSGGTVVSFGEYSVTLSGLSPTGLHPGDLIGTGGGDWIAGFAGADQLDGGPGDDTITGGAGEDTARFDAISSTVLVSYADGVFVILSAMGQDLVTGVELFAFVDTTLTAAQMIGLAGGGATGKLSGLARTGTPGPDELDGAETDDILIGLAGNDRLRGMDGDDILAGGSGGDTLNGGAGDDTITGGSSKGDLRDVIYAGAGNDSADGGYGNDQIFGMDDNATIAGGFGADELQGQNGNDVITGSDWVQDHTAAEGDVLLFGGTATATNFQINFAHTASPEGERSGDDNVQEAFVIYKPTEQIIWALVDGAGQDENNIQFAGSDDTFNLLG